MKPYEYLDISGDAGIRSFGNTAAELFANAAVGMYNLITDTEGIEKVETIGVSLKHESPEGLLVAWLNELIFQFDAHGFIGKEIAITDFSFGKNILKGEPSYSITASVTGEYFDPDRHHGKLLIKAATYHNLNIRNKDGSWTAEIIFDI